jgi:hypothetical protein
LASLVLTDAQLLSDYADNIKKSGQMADLPAYVPNLVSQSHSWAVGKIVSTLAARGYSPSQIASADQTGDYERALTLFMAHKRAAVIEGTSDTNVKTLDFTEGLKDVVLTQGGQFVIPAGPFGIPKSGLPDTSDDIFVWPDETDQSDIPGPGRGEPLNW